MSAATPTPVGAPQPESGQPGAAVPALTPPTTPKPASAKDDKRAAGNSSPAGASNQVDLKFEKFEKIDGAGQVFGTQNIYYGPENARLAAALSWQDEMDSVPVLLEPGQAVADDEVARHAAALQTTRLLLLTHAPQRQNEAVAHMRAVLQCLKKREPDRAVFTGRSESTWQLHSLYRAGEWRPDRRGSVIYLYRSTDPAALHFFSHIEQVGALCQKLQEMDCRLVLTVSRPASYALRDSHLLARRIALWPFDDEQPTSALTELPATFSSRFEIVVALCTALLPGLGVAEFVALVDLLVPAPPPPPPKAPAVSDVAKPSPAPAEPAQPPPPPSRHQRWHQGERDAVLGELGVQLRRPLQGDVASAEAADAGLYFKDPVLQSEMPEWLLGTQPILLTECLAWLAEHYLSASASQRYCAGYRRLLLRLDAVGVKRLTPDGLLLQLGPQTLGDAGFGSSQRLAELLLDVPGGPRGDGLVARVIDGVAKLIAAWEADLVEALLRDNLLAPAIDGGRAPYAAEFWTELHQGQAARSLIERTAVGQAALTDLLLSLASRAPGDVAQALGAALAGSNDSHRDWLQHNGLWIEPLAVVSLARVVFRDLQGNLLLQAPAGWLLLAEALGEAHANNPPRPAPADANEAARRAMRGRWLAWDCVRSLASLFDDGPSQPLSAAVHSALLGDDALPRFADVLATLLGMSAPTDPAAAGSAEPVREVRVDFATMRWLYRSLALALMAPPALDPALAAGRVVTLVAPLRARLRAAQRSQLLRLAQAALDDDFVERDALPKHTTRQQLPQARRELSQRIQALQMVMRVLRGAATAGAVPTNPSNVPP